MSDAAELIEERLGLAALCAEIREAGLFGLDTEFVSERTYWPELGLVQISTPERIAVVDALAVDTRPLWELVADAEIVTVAHAYEAEARFCWQATDREPAALFDVQLAAGFEGLRYPMAYGTLVRQVLRRDVRQSETRTDWTRRPLSARQLQYASDDVVFLLPLFERLRDGLERTERLVWLEEETGDRLAALVADLITPQWRRMAGSRKLSGRSLAALREIYLWREAEAKARNVPRKRVLRDDLVLAAAGALPESEVRLRQIRGVDQVRAGDREDVVAAVARAVALPEAELPTRRGRSAAPAQARMLALFLEAVLESACQRANVDATLVGGASDLREFVRWELQVGDSDGEGTRGGERLPALLRGWRREVCGDVLESAVRGEVLLRVANTASEHPLEVVEEE